MRSTLLNTTALSQPPPMPPGILDARQLEHRRLADEMEARMRSLPRVGATFMAQALFQGAWAHRMMSTMTPEEEWVWLAKSDDGGFARVTTTDGTVGFRRFSKRGSISSTFPDGRIAFEGTYDYLKISREGALSTPEEPEPIPNGHARVTTTDGTVGFRRVSRAGTIPQLPGDEGAKLEFSIECARLA